MNIAFYCRVAHPDTDALEQQEKMLLRFAEVNGYETDTPRIYLDNGASGQTLNRPGMNKLLADIQAGCVDTVLVKGFSCIVRSNGLLEKWALLLRSHNVRLVSIHEGEYPQNWHRMCEVLAEK